MNLQLYIGNKNYSSWSMRPWVLLRQAGIAFDETKIRFDAFTAQSQFKQSIGRVSPAGLVPVLVADGFPIWDTMSIVEFAAESFPDRGLWPADRWQRARARTLCAEMHAGFGTLRSAFGMNIEARLPEVGARLLAERPEAARDLARIVSMWSDQLAASGGPMLFGDFTAADAYFAPVVMRIRTYALPVPQPVSDYVQRVLALSAVREWERDALAEQDFLDFEEPHRKHR